MSKKEQNKLAKELFKMAYSWGRWNIKVSYNSQAWQTEVGRLLGNKSNGYHRVGNTTMECFILDCPRKKHLAF